MSSYVTLEEANEYVLTHYTSESATRKMWDETSDEDKMVILTVSADAINNLPLTGCKTYPDQENAFPRYPNEEVPKAVKYAQVENALTTLDSSSNEDIEMYRRMWSFGISSYSIGNLSETVGNASGGAAMLQSGIISTIAQSLLQPFIGGGFRIE